MTVNAIAPGPVGTNEFFRAMDEPAVAALQALVPIKRIGTPEEVAAAVSFLVSADSSYVTGVTLDVNGGVLMR